MFSEIIRKEAQYGRFVNLYSVAIVLTIEVGIRGMTWLSNFHIPSLAVRKRTKDDPFKISY